MFIYQTKINEKDGLIALPETQDNGNQLPIFGEEVFTISESDGVLEQKDLVLTEGGDTQKYTIEFVDDDETTVLQSSQVAYGETPAYTGETPTKEATAQYTYTFSKWTPDLAPVTADATYTAKYSKSTNKYDITFVNYDESVLQTSKVAYGQTPSYSGETPTKPETDEYTYTFDKWSPDIVSVTGTATYTATFTETAKQG